MFNLLINTTDIINYLKDNLAIAIVFAALIALILIVVIAMICVSVKHKKAKKQEIEETNAVNEFERTMPSETSPEEEKIEEPIEEAPTPVEEPKPAEEPEYTAVLLRNEEEYKTETVVQPVPVVSAPVTPVEEKVEDPAPAV
nr:hypothetical protein [Clostridiales bacterium]